MGHVTSCPLANTRCAGYFISSKYVPQPRYEGNSPDCNAHIEYLSATGTEAGVYAGTGTIVRQEGGPFKCHVTLAGGEQIQAFWDPELTTAAKPLLAAPSIQEQLRLIKPLQ